MNKIKLIDVLHLSEDEIRNSKIEFNMKAGKDGQPFLDRWLQYDDDLKSKGRCPYCSYWSSYGKQSNFRVGQMVFSFARLEGDDWLLISAALIVKVHQGDFADVSILEEYSPFFGRLIVSCKKGQTFSRYTFNLKKYLSDAVVKEVLPCIYSGEQFEGYDRVNLPFRRLQAIFEGRIMPTYHEALKKITGIYCLTDTKTGKLYIGSATGMDGVAQRWGNYLDSKHGGNKKLIALKEEKGDDYFESYFTFTLLEYYGLSYDEQKVIEREQYWKRCLDTIRNGYNDN